MQVVLFEDPACSWCWAFQPSDTTFRFEFGDELDVRRVMGGLRDQPLPDRGFLRRQWLLAAEVSGMPFDPSILEARTLQSTFHACRAVKAVQVSQPALAERYLRRVREAFYVERVFVDDLNTLYSLATEVGVSLPKMEDHVDSARAEGFFRQDQAEAARFGFGFPTMVLMPTPGDTTADPVLLQGAVPYDDIVKAISEFGSREEIPRRIFRDTPDDWRRLFGLHTRLTLAEVAQVTGLEEIHLRKRLLEFGVDLSGPFCKVPAHTNFEPRQEDLAV
ncbi:MAG: DsbA family protein [Planctomycetota bacterium]